MHLISRTWKLAVECEKMQFPGLMLLSHQGKLKRGWGPGEPREGGEPGEYRCAQCVALAERRVEQVWYVTGRPDMGSEMQI